VPEKFAFDRGSVRSVDADGRLHVAISNISKATINPYRGAEIPKSEELGLEADKIYWLLRDPDELAKAAPTFNNLPLLRDHVPVSADSPHAEMVVGSTGTDAVFNAPYLQNSLVVWDSEAIAGVETSVQKELSSAYRYRADMTPGTYKGQNYDGVMRDIIGNHVALVEVGRAGSDVVVMDTSPFTEFGNMKTSRTAIAVRAALVAYMRPKLAVDSLPGDLNALVRGVKQATITKDLARIKKDAAKLKLAQDAQLDCEELIEVLAAAVENVEDEPIAGDEEETEEEKEARLKKEKEDADKKAQDEKDEKVTDKKAMDSAIAAAETRVRREMAATRQAEQDVRPLLGDVVAQDSAEAVYKIALDHLKIDVTDVHPSAYRALVRQGIAAAGAQQAAPAHVAMDSAERKGYAEKYNVSRLVRG
jgi:hypothetical protein